MVNLLAVAQLLILHHEYPIYENIDKISAVNCPVLVIHETADEVVDYSHGKQLNFVLGLGKPKPAANGPQKASTESENQSKPAESGATDTFDLKPEISRNSLDSRLEKTKKSNKPEKSRMSTDRVDRFRRRKGLVW
ncbi:hypothetical protein KY290_015198 [Solanum tuberosum]|uniref:Uncharacterized protein n=1 Tax=Solanum tuberosum TaxID=4113 RepID=A0ABQ7VRU3_SOLTU|nr:hypothetical protein KY289_014816 [Solanum tuberosum]KAH0771217.1 hypothetical protein KY290_015198 [Solanum tuberosum]